MLTLSQTTRSYSGRPGCMCGCMGQYKESARSRQLAITQLLRNPAVRLDVWNNDQEGAVFVVTATRNRVLYLNQAGVAAARAMGLKELK